MTLEWRAPAGGLWELESTHVRGGQPRVFQELAPGAFREGFRRAASRYGLPIDFLDVRFVNDHCYARMRPLGAPEPKPGDPARTPPMPFLWVLARLHPALRRRSRTAKRALRDKQWHADRVTWEAERSTWISAARDLQSEPIESHDDVVLLDHLRRAANHLERGIAAHLDLSPVHDIPVGRLLLAARAWDIEPREVLGLLAGASPASSASSGCLHRIAVALAEADTPAVTLDGVRHASTEAADALHEYLADHGWRVVTQYSPGGRALIELPHVLVQAIKAAQLPPGRRPEPDVDAVRQRVPQADRARFDDLVADARSCYGVRDDNVALTFLWPSGLVRRSLLEVGRRLAERGGLLDPSHVFSLELDEIAGALCGGECLADVAAERAASAAAAEAQGAPLQLGDDEGAPPDPGVFPAAMAELVAASMVGFELEQVLTQRMATPRWAGAGTGVGSTSYTGRACVATSADHALQRLEVGDVLVVSHTTPAFEAILGIAGALVTDHGGLLSHAAIVCREHAIPAVVGVHAATASIPDGATVTVDAATGLVSLQDASDSAHATMS